MFVIACSAEKEQMETIRDLAKEAITIQLQLPESTVLNEKSIVLNKDSDSHKTVATYSVSVKVISQNASVEELVDIHII